MSTFNMHHSLAHRIARHINAAANVAIRKGGMVRVYAPDANGLRFHDASVVGQYLEISCERSLSSSSFERVCYYIEPEDQVRMEFDSQKIRGRHSEGESVELCFIGLALQSEAGNTATFMQQQEATSVAC